MLSNVRRPRITPIRSQRYVRTRLVVFTQHASEQGEHSSTQMLRTRELHKRLYRVKHHVRDIVARWCHYSLIRNNKPVGARVCSR